jgi:hypothetical protein
MATCPAKIDPRGANAQAKPLDQRLCQTCKPADASLRGSPATNVASEAFPGWERASCFGSCSQMCNQNSQEFAEKPRSGDSLAPRSGTNGTSETAIVGSVCWRSLLTQVGVENLGGM